MKASSYEETMQWTCHMMKRSEGWSPCTSCPSETARPVVLSPSLQMEILIAYITSLEGRAWERMNGQDVWGKHAVYAVFSSGLHLKIDVCKTTSEQQPQNTRWGRRGAWLGSSGHTSPQLGARILTGRLLPWVKPRTMGSHSGVPYLPNQISFLTDTSGWGSKRWLRGQPNLRRPSFWSSPHWAYENSLSITEKQSTLTKAQSWAICPPGKRKSTE